MELLVLAAAGFGGARLFEWFNDFVIGRNLGGEERFFQLRVQYWIYEVASHSRAVGELKFTGPE